MVVGGEHGNNEWVDQTTITTAHSSAEDHDTSPANPSTRTSPSSPFNILCGALGVHNRHKHTHTAPAHACMQECMHAALNKHTLRIHIGAYGNTHVNLSVGCKYMLNQEKCCVGSAGF